MGALQILMRSNPMRLVRSHSQCARQRAYTKLCTCHPMRISVAAARPHARIRSTLQTPLPVRPAPVPTLLLPLQPGLSFVQSLLFFEAAAHHWLAIPTIFMAIVPIVFLFCNSASPLVVSPRNLTWQAGVVAWLGRACVHRCFQPACCTTSMASCPNLCCCPSLQAAHIWEFVAFFGVW